MTDFSPFSTLQNKANHIAIVTHFYGSHGGGIELVAERLIREMETDPTLQFAWIASDTDPAPKINGNTTLPMRCWNFCEKALGIPWPIWGWRSLKRMHSTIAQADAVWLHDTLYFGNILAYACAKKLRKPVMITQHIAPVPYCNPMLRGAMKIADKLFSSRMLLGADEVIFISDRVAEDYYRRLAFKRPIKVIPNGVDIRTFHLPMAETRRYLRQQFALKNEQIVFLFVGRFVERKGLDVLRRLAKLMPECRFWLAGKGPIKPEKWHLPNVHVFRGRKGEALADLYKSADLLLIPSYGEGFPLVIQEAMACGLPVLCGPETARGNAMATPFLQIADVWPDNPERTAAVWHKKLKTFPIPLPIIRPSESMAEFALTTWDWPPIARVYAGLLKDMAANGKAEIKS
ncbi:MAG: glycosyltransferase family 1 protein [Proteobacteria bacterium]|jgi:glycosyltransferase involved in cell wall biosynthesis|nr:glycosyltransferase family 4 protein [Alphaproteobacteria bacterium]NCC02874.1 glycosyltransferase family 1 protein [Pseudomonadota bacterium]